LLSASFVLDSCCFTRWASTTRPPRWPHLPATEQGCSCAF
jgi:hypothetical protein